MSDADARFAICINNRGYEASLEPRKLYQVLPDPQAAKLGYIRVIDESDEDYLFPSRYFIPVPLPEDVERAVLAATDPPSQSA